jgi:pimeloyl-ACP methyl ester carboxylesterase
MFHVTSNDGVSIAVHELAGTGDLPALLIAHATGFHAHCYAPIARALGDRFRVLALDFHGHGETAPVPDWTVDWSHFGDDAEAVAAAIAPDGALVGFGHSMGGAALLMAAHRRPDLFSQLVLFEPIAHVPVPSKLSEEEMRQVPIIAGALRRRRRFPSFQNAYENYRSKPPMSLMVDEVLRNYVDYGFHAIVDEHDQPAVELRCTPEIEAGIFMGGRDNGVWALLAEIATPAVVIGGRVEEMQPSSGTEAIADQLPNGEYILLDHQTHFGPFSHPDEITALIEQYA